jgi:thiamine biosynthesis protein ThiC
LIRSPDLDALCNGTALYDGAGISNGIGGEAIVFKGKALLCKLTSSGGRSHMVLPGRAED